MGTILDAIEAHTAWNSTAPACLCYYNKTSDIVPYIKRFVWLVVLVAPEALPSLCLERTKGVVFYCGREEAAGSRQHAEDMIPLSLERIRSREHSSTSLLSARPHLLKVSQPNTATLGTSDVKTTPRPQCPLLQSVSLIGDVIGDAWG